MLFGIAHGVLALPAPGVPAHVHQILFGLPAQLLSGLGGVCVAGSQVAGAAVHDLVGQLQVVGFLKGLDHIQHGVAGAGAQVEDFPAQCFS